MKRFLVINVCCLGLGILSWAGVTLSLQERGALEFDLNVLTLKKGPFGRTVAIAMRGPVDRYFGNGVSHAQGQGSGGACSHEGHAAEDCERNTSETLSEEGTVHRSLLMRIDEWNSAYNTRSNPLGSSERHQKFLMGETQKRLRLSYEMDPSNFAAYGSYFLFLSEALSILQEEGREMEYRQQAAQEARALCEMTIRYCQTLEGEPSALLTAAAAAHDSIQIRYQEGGEGMQQEILSFLKKQRECLGAFYEVKSRMTDEGNWDAFPEIRRQEMDAHAGLITGLLKADEAFIERNAQSSEEGPQSKIVTSS
jgi:hypothetical protein